MYLMSSFVFRASSSLVLLLLENHLPEVVMNQSLIFPKKPLSLGSLINSMGCCLGRLELAFFPLFACIGAAADAAEALESGAVAPP